MIRLLTLGPAEHEEVAIYVVNQRIPHVRELREQLCCGAIRGYQVRGKILFDPRACLENAFCKMCVTVCGKFVQDEGVVAGYDNRIRDKSPAKWGVQIAGMIFQTRSNIICILVRRLCTLCFFYRSLHGFYIITHIRNTAFPIGSTQLYDGRAYDSAV